MPQAFTEKMAALLGDEGPDFLNSLAGEGIHGLRVNTLKIDIEAFLRMSPFRLEPVPWSSSGFYYDASEQPGKHPYHAAGLYYIQEPSAMAPAALLDVKPGDFVLDLCSAPGGKASQLAAGLKGQGLLLANEIHPVRVTVLGENLERMGVTNAVITQETPARLADRFSCFFDRILVDAPCSGEGMFRKNPLAREEWSPDSPAACSQRQLDILREAAKMLKPGGRMVYSTCTFSPEENEGTLSCFLKEHPDYFVCSDAFGYRFAEGKPEWTGGLPELRHARRIWPHLDRGEGHFMALLERRGAIEGNNIIRKGMKKAMKSGGDKGSQADLSYFKEFVNNYMVKEFSGRITERNGHFYIQPEAPLDFSGLKVLRPGFYLGQVIKNRFEPSHALAMALKREDAVQVLDLPADSPDMAAYLRGETIACGNLRGWVLAAVDGYSIGWGKASGGVLKNHYPKGLRR